MSDDIYYCKISFWLFFEECCFAENLSAIEQLAMALRTSFIISNSTFFLRVGGLVIRKEAE
jgi:hypothetical protein